MAPNCYARDKLSGIEGKSENSNGNKAAARFGFARVGLSTPDGGWQFGNDGVVNDANPMPCSNDDSKDIHYVRKVMEFIQANPDQFDASKVYAQGFSQNSMFSAYIGFCLHDQIVGVWQGGSGLALTGKPPNLPGCQAQTSASDFADCKANGQQCKQCMVSSPCTECQYWPIYPCYSAARPMVDCVAEYTNDYISVAKEDPSESTAENMYERLVDEGHDARLLRFSPSDDGTIAGGHKDPKNTMYWIAGCLGITDPCDQVIDLVFHFYYQENHLISSIFRLVKLLSLLVLNLVMFQQPATGLIHLRTA